MKTKLIPLKEYSPYSKSLDVRELILQDVNKESLREWANRPTKGFKTIIVRDPLKHSAGLINFFKSSVYAILP